MGQDDYPAIDQHHLRDAKLYAHRWIMLLELGIKPNGVFAEVGVAHGLFSEFILERLTPKKFVAVDVFDMDRYESHWGVPSSELFKGMTHLDFYIDKFSGFGGELVIEQGLSWEAFDRQPDNHFDFIYIDAGHTYEDVRRDAEVALRKIKPNGVLVFNDYIMEDYTVHVSYGVVQAVNEIVVNQGWDVVGFALSRNMFCDIALRRSETR